LLDELHVKYTGVGKSVDNNEPIAPIQMPRGYGGTAIVWKKQGTSKEINFVSDLRLVGFFFSGTPVSSTNKTDCHDMVKILLKVAFSTITIILLVFPLFLGMYVMSMRCMS
jgi:hypothetical protein